MSQLHPDIIAIMEETGEVDAVAAIRVKARSFVKEYHRELRESPPFNLKAMASFRSLHDSPEPPRFSQDSEIAPEPDGRIVLRVNHDRPRTRQRFSIGHEIGHTFFPEYKLKAHCRKPVNRDSADPNDLLETLCDVAASELLFPDPWFPERVSQLELSADAIARLASEYESSPDATVRHLVEVHPEPMAAVYFVWKLKPTEIRQVNNDRNQMCMFQDDPLVAPEPMLRVDYSILNPLFQRLFCEHIPKDKSIPSRGPIHEASALQRPMDGAMWLDLGTFQGSPNVHAIPLYTSPTSAGPRGEVSVVAVLRPSTARPPSSCSGVTAGDQTLD